MRDPGIAGLVLRLLAERGILSAFCLFNPFVIRIEPPLIITETQLAQSLDHLASALTEAEQYVDRVEPAAIGVSRFVIERRIDIPPAALFTRLQAPAQLYPISPTITDVESNRAGEFACRGLLGNIQLEWVDALHVDAASMRITQRAVRGDWATLVRTFSVTPYAGDDKCSTLVLEVSWDAGTAEFERVLALQLRRSDR